MRVLKSASQSKVDADLLPGLKLLRGDDGGSLLCGQCLR